MRESPTGGWAGQSGQVGRKGFTLTELVIIVVILAVMAAVGLPMFSSLIRTSGVDGAARQVAGSIQEARAKAVRTGWEYRIFGGNGGGTQAYKNKYRLEGRSSGAVTWPLATEDNLQTATKVSERWFDFNKDYPGVVLNPSISGSFFLSFNSRGAVVAGSTGFPLSVAKSGTAKTVSVTLVGKVKIQ